jgi:hypothetical protein
MPGPDISIVGRLRWSRPGTHARRTTHQPPTALRRFPSRNWFPFENSPRYLDRFESDVTVLLPAELDGARDRRPSVPAYSGMRVYT